MAVERDNLERVVRLYGEYRAIVSARANLDAGGTIIQMTISGGPSGPAPPPSGSAPAVPHMPVTLATTEITYPPAMTEAIKASLNARTDKINEELQQLGAVAIGG